MDYKNEIEKLLVLLKDNGYGRRRIEAAFEYKPKSIDQILARGGNSKFLAALRIYCAAVLPKTTHISQSLGRKAGPPKAKDISERIRDLEANLDRTLKNQDGSLAFLWELLKRDARREAKGNEGKMKKILNEILHKLSPELGLHLRKDIFAHDGNDDMEIP